MPAPRATQQPPRAVAPLPSRRQPRRAGHLGLGRLICVYLDNRITIEGGTSLAFTEDVAKRFEAYGWHVQKVDGYELAHITSAIEAAKQEAETILEQLRQGAPVQAPLEGPEQRAHDRGGAEGPQ